MHISAQYAVLLLATSAAAWDASQLSEKLRKELCSEQVLYCTNVCGGEGYTREAFCNPATLGSKCQCSNGAEASVRRYQWPAFQRVCEAQRNECRTACDKSKIPAHEKSYCFSMCDYRMACSSDDAPDLKIMVDKFDDNTGFGKPKPKVDPKSPVVMDMSDDADELGQKKDKKKGDGLSSKKRASPVPVGKDSGATSLAGAVAALGMAALMAGSLF
ncbi:hypothetical protein DL89DRAFT_174326 [Linderina pennispora]|uniref:DUF7707 domain-containing protein n=1 Tax=Linderina pennispora TaxID=61395 RepID=A0A1Y1W6X5_9FUNG|nr:uncharacterized protein DL89DRAFT_174326 [Linderina pennispora]ORX69293.1 hypothetical protein DL89DRAFT_174326 [Linderina pennispora]